eukprot:12410847-Karenia_brevis.AAC.1
MTEEERAALGYHIGKANDITVWVYVRDRLAAPLAKLDEVLDAMRNNIFDPDEAIPFNAPRSRSASSTDKTVSAEQQRADSTTDLSDESSEEE